MLHDTTFKANMPVLLTLDAHDNIGCNTRLRFDIWLIGSFKWTVITKVDVSNVEGSMAITYFMTQHYLSVPYAD